MIRANCRARFTAADFDFIVRTLSRSRGDCVSLVDLLSDSETRDSILDHPRLVETVLSNAGHLHISSQFYFYVLARYVLQQAGIGDRKLCDYVGSLLETFSRANQLQSPDKIDNPEMIGAREAVRSRSRNSMGVTSSPRPRQIAGDWKMKNGTSEPIDSAIFASASRGSFVSNTSLSASRVEAASLLPPPSPAPCGIFFFNAMATPPFTLVASRKRLAARTTRLSSPLGMDGSLQEKSIQRD